MKYFATNYNHAADRMERISDKFETYKEAAEWVENNGPRNVDGDSIAMVGHDYYEATDYPVSEAVNEETELHTQSEVLAMCGQFGSVDREALVLAMVYVLDGGMTDGHAIDAALEIHPTADRKKLQSLLPLWG